MFVYAFLYEFNKQTSKIVHIQIWRTKTNKQKQLHRSAA